MNPPRSESPLESPREAETQSSAKVAGLYHAIGDRSPAADVAMKSGSSGAFRRGDPVTPASPRAGVLGDPRSARPDIAVRVSVIDGADRLVYSDVRDRRGWKQPLAAEQAENEVRRRHLGADGAPLSEPRTVRTLETASAYLAINQIDRTPSATRPSPYSLGKSSVSNASKAAQPKLASAPSRSQALVARSIPQASGMSR